jgi:hypothetical protein
MNSARDLRPSGSAFDAALHGEYLRQAEEEYAENDYGRSDGFADLAVVSASGNTREPANLANWDVPEANIGELTTARARLTTALDASGRTKGAGKRRARPIHV